MSGNKNVADYTNFDGRTNKKIVQAPGGASSFSLAWSNEPTDYGQQKNYRKPSREQNSDQYRHQQKIGYNEPMKVMDEPPKSYGSRNMGANNYSYGNQPIGGEHGYNNYNNSPQMNQPMMGGYGQQGQNQGYGNYGNYGNYKASNHTDQIDIAVQELKYNKRPPSMPRQQNPPTQGRSSIKINGPPQENHIFGNGQYNYWKDNNHNDFQQKKQTPSQKRIAQQQQDMYNQKNMLPVQKTSVKVHNPPGGKQSFTLG